MKSSYVVFERRSQGNEDELDPSYCCVAPLVRVPESSHGCGASRFVLAHGDAGSVVDALSSEDPSDSFVTYLCLVYHEARNVRHLVERGLRPEGPYAQLRLLPRNRDQAWATMQGLRSEARRRGGAMAAADVFAHHFCLSLEDLVDLYEDKNWKDAQRVGGYSRLRITRSLIELRDALDRDNQRLVVRLLAAIPDMSHNTGRVEEKIRGLDAALGGSAFDSSAPIN